MTNKERGFLLGGVGIGVATAALAMGAVAFQGEHKHASVPSAAAMRTAPESATNEGTQPGSTVELTPEEISAAGVQVVAVGKARLKSELEAFGRVEQPEAQLAVISARIGGRIDKLYVDYTGQAVRRGQPVAEIYSPEVASSIEEYRLALENRERMRNSSLSLAREQSDDMANAARRRLELWGLSNKQLDSAAAGPIPATITTYASVGGTVTERKVARGQYVNAGDTLFTVADLSQVWVKADVYESQLPSVHPGQAVEITADALPGKVIHGEVELVEPSANAETRTVPVHVHVANPGMRLRPGMFVRTKFAIHNGGDTVVVPRSAVLDTGTRNLVFLAREGGTFEAREIEVGAGTDEFFPVLRGLAAGDKVVTNGNFLIDSQTRLSGSMSSLFGGSKEFKNEEPQKSTAPPAQIAPSKEAAKLTFMIDPNPPKGAADAMFHITLNDATGKPIPDAQVKVTLVMPAMPSMGMPEMRTSYDVPWSGGMYMGKGNIPMAGPWNVTVDADRNGQRIATYRTRVTAK